MRRNQTEDADRKDELAADRRRSNKEGGIPASGDDANVKWNRRSNSDPDQDYRDQHDHDRHDRVHRNAQCAMVGIVIGRMDVRYLGDCKQREQDQAHNRRHLQSVWLRRARRA
jgi:hypothetical protein